MNKLFANVYGKLIKQEWNPEGINVDAIAAVTKGWSAQQPASRLPNDDHWYWDRNGELLGLDMNTYHQIVQDIRLEKFTIDNILNLMQYFLSNKGKGIFEQYIDDNKEPGCFEPNSTADRFWWLLCCMVEQGPSAFPSKDDYLHLKVFQFMEDTLQANQKLSLIGMDRESDEWEYNNKVSQVLDI